MTTTIVISFSLVILALVAGWLLGRSASERSDVEQGGVEVPHDGLEVCPQPCGPQHSRLVQDPRDALP